MLVRDRARRRRSRRGPGRSARRTWSTCRAASRRYLLDAWPGARSVGRCSTPTPRRGRSPVARPGRWSWPGTRFDLPRSGWCHGRCAGGRGSGSCRARRSCPTTTPGRSRCPRSSRCRHRAGRWCSASTRRRRVVGQRRRVAGPRAGLAGHGLARPPPRALPRRRDVPALRPVARDRAVAAPALRGRRDSRRSRQSGLTVRKQSEQ